MYFNTVKLYIQEPICLLREMCGFLRRNFGNIPCFVWGCTVCFNGKFCYNKL